MRAYLAAKPRLSSVAAQFEENFERMWARAGNTRIGVR
jgi:hypothetical protein